MKKNMIFAMLLLTLTLTLTGCSTGVSSNKAAAPLKVGMELAYPPFETKDTNGNPTGVSVDFARALGEYLGKEVVIENMAWDGLIPALEAGKVDIVISSMTITDARKERISFSKPYAKALLALLVNKDSGIQTPDDLNQAGKKVAVKTGSTGNFFATDNLKNAQVLSLADESACVTEVVQGKADAFIYDQLTIYRNQKANADKTDAVYIPFQNVEFWGVGVKKDNIRLLGDVNTFIDYFRGKDGLDAITAKYLSEEKKDFEKLGFEWFF